jgi:hypothetical protein
MSLAASSGHFFSWSPRSVNDRRSGQKIFYRLTPDSLVNTLTGYAFEICPVAGPLKRESRALAKRRRSAE